MYDLIIIGAGAVGSATAYAAAKAGVRVLLLEQYEIDHQRGSSHGASRIIRYAYDHPIYVGMARDAYAAWAEVEADAGETFYRKTGGIDFAHPGEKLLSDMRRTLLATGIPHEMWTAADAMHHFPQFHLEDDMQVLYQANAGVLRASPAVRAFVRLARDRGATVRDRTPVTGITVQPDSVTVTSGNEHFDGARLVIAGGAWLSRLIEPLGVRLPLQPIAPQENYFHAGTPGDFRAERFPVWIGHLQAQYGQILYGLPDTDDSGVKIGLHGGKPIDPESAERTPDAEVIASMTRFAQQYLPDAARHKSSRICLYTNTPDEHFVMDYHPEHHHVVIASCCSGHAFKFSPVLGQTLARLALNGEAERDLSLFRIDRFSHRLSPES